MPFPSVFQLSNALLFKIFLFQIECKPLFLVTLFLVHLHLQA